MFSSILAQISGADIGLIFFLGFLETILSVDNALVLALMVHELPIHLRKRALTYGLFGAVFFRLVSLTAASYLMQWPWIKLIGAAYLGALSIKHFFFSKPEESEGVESTDPASTQKKAKTFWKTVLWIELMDLAFAVDSILAATAVSQKVWVIFVGGMIGVLAIRFAASGLSELLDKFPAFERTAYLLILWIAIKLFLEGLQVQSLNFHSSSHPSFWIFWSLMAGTLISGFVGKQKEK